MIKVTYSRCIYTFQVEIGWKGDSHNFMSDILSGYLSLMAVKNGASSELFGGDKKIKVSISKFNKEEKKVKARKSRKKGDYVNIFEHDYV